MDSLQLNYTSKNSFKEDAYTRARNEKVEGIVVMTAMWHVLLAANTAPIHAFSFVDFAFPLLDSVG